MLRHLNRSSVIISFIVMWLSLREKGHTCACFGASIISCYILIGYFVELLNKRDWGSSDALWLTRRTTTAALPFLTRWPESSSVLFVCSLSQPPLFDRLSQAIVVVPLVLLDFKRCGNCLHPPGTRPLHCGCGGGILHHYPPLLVVPHYGQPAGEGKQRTRRVVLRRRKTVHVKKCRLCFSR